MMLMPKTPYRIPLTAAALAILLAACGGGSSGGSNRVVSSSPTASGPTDSSGTITAGGSATLNVNANATATADSSSTSGANASTTPPASNTSNPSAPGTDSTSPPATTNPSTPPANTNTPPADSGASNGGGGNATTPNPPSTTPSAPTTTPSQVNPTQPRAPIAAAGVRGDALLTMFDQKVCATPQQATAHNGSAVTPADSSLPPLQPDVALSPSNYLPVPGAPSTQSQYGALNNISCDPKLYPYAAAKAGDYSIRASTYPTNMFLYTHSFGQAFEGRPYTGAIAAVPLTIADNGQATIGTTAKIETMVVNKDVKPGGSAELSTANSFSFGPTDQVSYGVLQQWTGGTDFTKLMLLPGNTANEARLCWNIDTKQVKRLHCTVWRPTADWKRGQPLELVDQYLVDDRSVHANESGFLYWRTKFPG
ncbi:MAG: hypothetical protein Q4D91_03505 [Lautropia sp.]|nr:hypothetical protein [Lautropia sp.]